MQRSKVKVGFYVPFNSQGHIETGPDKFVIWSRTHIFYLWNTVCNSLNKLKVGSTTPTQPLTLGINFHSATNSKEEIKDSYGNRKFFVI